MKFFRKPLRVAVSLKEGVTGRAYFRIPEGGEPELEGWDSHPALLTRKTILRFATTCCGKEGMPFLQMDVRTPYGDAADEDHVAAAVREALGPKADALPVFGWNVTHLADTHLGSNHRIFATLTGPDAPSISSECWDQILPMEMGLLALGDYAARKTGNSNFQLIADLGSFAYSLIYKESQPWHVIRIHKEPWGYAQKRLKEHRLMLPETEKSAPVFLLGTTGFRTACADFLGATAQPLPLPSDISTDGAEPHAWHFGLALAALQQEYSVHNYGTPENGDANRMFRLVFATVKAGVWAAVLGGAVLLAEAGRYYLAGRALNTIKWEAASHAKTLDTLQSLRNERGARYSSLLELRPLWTRPVPLSALIREITASLPASGALEGFMLRRIEGGRMEVSFRVNVRDWNHIRPMQTLLQKSSLFSRVEFSDQSAAGGGRGVLFQGSCILAESP